MPEININLNGVDKIIIPHKAAGPDKLRPHLLKESHQEILPILTFVSTITRNRFVTRTGIRYKVNLVEIFKKVIRHLAVTKPHACSRLLHTCINSQLTELELSIQFMKHPGLIGIHNANQHGFSS